MFSLWIEINYSLMTCEPNCHILEQHTIFHLHIYHVTAELVAFLLSTVQLQAHVLTWGKPEVFLIQSKQVPEYFLPCSFQFIIQCDTVIEL